VLEMPLGAEEFRRLPGVGESKLSRYGDAFLSVIRQHVDALHD